MSDLIYVAIVIGFFAVAFALLRACEHIIGPDLPSTTNPSDTTSSATPSATPVEVKA